MADQKVYGPLNLPSGMQVYFRRPTGLDRANVMDTIEINDEQFTKGSIQVENGIRAKCLVKVNGVDPDVNFKNVFNSWDDGDIQFYTEVFVQMFGMTEEKRASAKQAAAFLLNSSTSTDGSSSMAESTTTAG
ncbi:hypothetical protein PP175_05635 [Aneurinibacillus sp. Ricciae_BoGa-3]|uniref:hypothetical protein n=1 Tax=Aneurinibacillus sp. Ricciae_BoGa-3 TaxID=3022697 RepID=UPI00233FE5B2|nr:hypothetical protein [Aneurinibacillus sp. Ricciae_BoGa-3]WCK55432.1 hypothetical protein PP175_05635 [Aneurinibacillus sp. Ricciae_BoGa-3]